MVSRNFVGRLHRILLDRVLVYFIWSLSPLVCIVSTGRPLIDFRFSKSGRHIKIKFSRKWIGLGECWRRVRRFDGWHGCGMRHCSLRICLEIAKGGGWGTSKLIWYSVPIWYDFTFSFFFFSLQIDFLNEIKFWNIHCIRLSRHTIASIDIYI